MRRGRGIGPRGPGSSKMRIQGESLCLVKTVFDKRSDLQPFRGNKTTKLEETAGLEPPASSTATPAI
jgi:hypothetical protein